MYLSPKDSGIKASDADTVMDQNDSTSLPIDIEYVSYNDTIEWQDMVVQLGKYSLSIPDEWIMIDGMDYGLLNGAFFVPPETGMENFQFDSHVAIEIEEGPFFTEASIQDYALEATQKDFFAYMIASTFSKMGGLSDLKFSVWNMDDNYIYIVDFTRSNETLTMYQTTYYVMRADQTVMVYATTFGEDSEIPVHEAACHLIVSLIND